MARPALILRRLARVATVVSCVALLGAAAAEAAPVSAEQMQTWFHREVDRTTPFPWLAAASKDPVHTGQAHALLDELWKEPAYRAHLAAWLAARQDDALENVLADWYPHYHSAFEASLEFVDDADVRRLWRLSGRNALYAVDRASCDQKTQGVSTDELLQLQQDFIKAQGSSVVAALAKAVAREFARQDHPVPGDRPIQQVMMPMVLKAFNEVASSLPPDDGARLRKLYSMVASREMVPVGEICQRHWVAARAVEDANVKNAALLRQTMTASAYGQAFDPFDQQGDAGKPAILSFTPGRASLVVPRVGLVNNVRGDVVLEIAVGEDGKAESVKLVKNGLSPSQVTSIDGSAVDVGPQYAAAAERYLRSGVFAPRLLDGKPVRYKVQLPLAW